jgi:DNA (cytosine-5)-methyltransferase 1
MLKVLELFGGIGACSKALERLGVEHEIVDYVEIDKHAVKSFNAIHNTNFEPQDITTWDKDIEVDLIMHGSPCQDFSLAGKQAGGDKDSGTRSSLLYETIRIVSKLKPKYVIWENVKNVISQKHRHNFDEYLKEMEELGYTNYYQVLNAKDYGIPQNRERVFTVSVLNSGTLKDISFKFPQKQELKLKLKDMLEDFVDGDYFLTNKQIKRTETTTYNVGKTRIQKKDWCDTLCARDWKDPKCVEVDAKYYLSDKMKVYINKTGTANYKNKDCKINLEVARPLTTDPNKRAGTTNYISKDLPEECNIADMDLKEYKIRKLTPKEYWSLMGFNDEDFDKASQVCSNSQLYKQAGNSIVVNVLEEILKELLL